MEKISKKKVEEIYKGLSECKMTKGSEVESLKSVYEKAIHNFLDYLSSLSAYEMAQAINSITHFIEDKTQERKPKDFERGDIIIVDYGFMNFGFEFSFPHPSVVLSATKNYLFVAPCTTKKFGRGFSDVLDSYIEDGFQENTGVLLDGVRWISKNRAIEKIGCASYRVLRKIEEFTLNHMLTYTFEKSKRRKEMVKLQIENDTLRMEVEMLRKANQ
jgi:mRNA-degrading endonuclease toxin of MazEF toxin-antitoxin module